MARAKPKKRKAAKRVGKPKQRPKPKRRRLPPIPQPEPTRVPRDRRALVGALEYASDLANRLGPVLLDMRGGVPSRNFLWAIAGRFAFRYECTYRIVGQILSLWEASRTLANRIGRQRITRIAVQYTNDRGEQRTYGIGETGPWESCIARALYRVRETNSDRQGGERESLIAAYDTNTNRTTVTAIVVWIADQYARSATVRIAR